MSALHVVGERAAEVADAGARARDAQGEGKRARGLGGESEGEGEGEGGDAGGGRVASCAELLGVTEAPILIGTPHALRRLLAQASDAAADGGSGAARVRELRGDRGEVWER